MKFSASSADLLDALNTVKGAVPSKSTLPILECILFEQSDDGSALVLSATDLEISIVRRVEVQFASNGTSTPQRIAVPSKRLVDTLRALPDLPISFTADGDFEIQLETDQGHYKMVGHDGDDFPDLPEVDAAHTISAEGALVSDAINKTSFAVSKDALRPAMMGIYFQLDAEGSRIVATDGHRLVKLDRPALQTDGEEVSFIVPEKATKLVSRILDDDALCTIGVSEGHVSFTIDDARVIARLIDETYPNYNAVIPDENDRQLVVNREALLSAVKRVGLYSSSMTNQIRLALSESEMTVSAEDIERSSEAEEVIRCEYDSDNMEIGFNSEYLTEVLGNVDTEEVLFRLSSPNRAGIVVPNNTDDPDILMLIMPVMLNTYA